MPQHLFIPLATWPSHAGQAATPLDQALPHLAQLLGTWFADTPLAVAADWVTPIERCYADALGWHASRATTSDPLPLAALQDQATDAVPCAWVRPVHLISSMNDVRVCDPSVLRLSAAEAQPLFQALAELCKEDGLQLDMRTPTRWLLRGEALRHIRTPSLALAANQHIADYQPFLPDSVHTSTPTPESGEAKGNLQWLLRLQNEAQMLFYTHPVNDARHAQRRPEVSGIWVEGAGAVATPAATAPTKQVIWCDALSAHADDAHAWQAAWRALDSDSLAPLLANPAGTGDAVTFGNATHAITWRRRAPTWWRRAKQPWQRLKLGRHPALPSSLL